MLQHETFQQKETYAVQMNGVLCSPISMSEKKMKSRMTYRTSELENVSSGHGNLDSFVAFYWYDTSRRKELLWQLRSTKDLQEDGNKWTGRKEGRAVHSKMFCSL
jgi:hypothetical protein